MKKALVFGASGQTGSFLAEILADNGYEVHGVVRRASTINTSRLDHLHRIHALQLHYGDVTDADSINKILLKVKPDEIYNLAAQSHVRVSFDIPLYTADVVALGTLRILEAVRNNNLDCKIYNSSSSEMFGSSPAPQSELTPFQPRSPYGCAKVFAHHVAVNFREAYNAFVVNGICFNHESNRRGETFVTRKITRAVGRIVAGTQKKLILGNLQAKRDWGHAKDYAKAIYLMMQQDKPKDYVIGTGETYTVQEFVEKAFSHKNLNWQDYVEIDPKYFRPTEVDILQADASLARRELNWSPSYTFTQLVHEMVDHDVDLAFKEHMINDLNFDSLK